MASKNNTAKKIENIVSEPIEKVESLETKEETVIEKEVEKEKGIVSLVADNYIIVNLHGNSRKIIGQFKYRIGDIIEL